MGYKKCAKLLLEQNDILIITHKNPDGDCMGSAAALCSALRRQGKTAYLYANSQVNRKMLPYVEEFFAPEGFEAKYRVAVDVAAERMFALGFEGEIDMYIDHHPGNERRAANMLVHPEMAACAQLVMKVIKAMGGGITAQEAELLYIALTTDCGCFRYANTDAAALEAAAELVRCGADCYKISEEFFNLLSPGRMKLEGLMYNDMRFYREGKLCIVLVTRAMMEKAGATNDDCDDIANIACRAEGSLMSITVKEMDDGSSKVSVRSKPGISSREVCAVFGGGGHEQASGCCIDAAPEKAGDMLLAVVNEVWK